MYHLHTLLNFFTDAELTKTADIEDTCRASHYPNM